MEKHNNLKAVVSGAATNRLVWAVLAVAAGLLMPEMVLAEGRSLEQAASAAVNITTLIAKGIVGLGFAVGCILYCMPEMVGHAKRAIFGSVMGGICLFGGPGIIRAIQSIF